MAKQTFPDVRVCGVCGVTYEHFGQHMRRCRQCLQAYNRAYKANRIATDPEYAARVLEQRKRSTEKRNERRLAAKVVPMIDCVICGVSVERVAARQKFCEPCQPQQYNMYQREYARNRYATDPVWRERRKEKGRRDYAAAKARRAAG